MKIIDEMLSLDLLSTQQHHAIASWVQTAGTPEAIMAMPPHLWHAIEVASVAMNIDADLTRPSLNQGTALQLLLPVTDLP